MLQRIQKIVYKAVMFLWHYWRERLVLAWAYESESLLTHLRLEHRTEPVSPQCKYIHTYIHIYTYLHSPISHKWGDLQYRAKHAAPLYNCY